MVFFMSVNKLVHVAWKCLFLIGEKSDLIIDLELQGCIVLVMWSGFVIVIALCFGKSVTRIFLK